jgi:hypothetical protein
VARQEFKFFTGWNLIFVSFLPAGVCKTLKEPCSVVEPEPWMFRGGLIADLQVGRQAFLPLA